MGLFDGFDKEVVGPWNKGHYQGVIIKEYESTGQMTVIHRTEDKVSKDGDSRNLKLCVALVNGGKQKFLNYHINYRPEALNEERVAELKALRAKKVQMAGVDFRDNMSLIKLHELEKAGVVLQQNSHGGFDVSEMTSSGHVLDFYLSIYRMTGGKESEPVPKDVLNNPDVEDEERARWFNKITSVNPAK